jgi:glycine cleavage system aminomethyltransferase T
MFRDLASSSRRFIGRAAIEREIADKTSRWKMVGLMVDWREWDRHFGEAGLIPPKDETPVVYEMML